MENEYEYPNNGIGDNARKIDGNASDISDNRDGLMETFETYLSNTDDIATLREGLMEVYELIESEV